MLSSPEIKVAEIMVPIMVPTKLGPTIKVFSDVILRF